MGNRLIAGPEALQSICPFASLRYAMLCVVWVSPLARGFDEGHVDNLTYLISATWQSIAGLQMQGILYRPSTTGRDGDGKPYSHRRPERSTGRR